MRKSVQITGALILVLFLIASCVWYAAYQEDTRGRLTISFLGVGQGSAVFIQAPSGRQVLINGGPDAGVLRSLGSVMPPWDRSIDVVIATDARVGEVSGLVDVLQRYTVETILQTSVESTAPMWNLFEKEAQDDALRGTKVRTAHRGQVVDLGKGVYLEVLFPDRNLLSAGVGEGCVVMRLTYGATSALFPCGSTQGVQNYLAMLDGTNLKSNILLSEATSSPIFLGYVAPEYTVHRGEAATFVSDGKAVMQK